MHITKEQEEEIKKFVKEMSDDLIVRSLEESDLLVATEPLEVEDEG